MNVASLKSWLWRIRDSTRLAGLLQLGARVAISVLSLFWARLLLELLGKPVYGLFLSFQAFASLGGLGELGMGGAVSLRVGRGLGRGDKTGLIKFLSSARLVFASMAFAVLVAVLALSSHLPHWLGFESIPGAGNIQLLFMMGAISMALAITGSYFNNLNYACGNVVWGILPGLLLAQLSIGSQVLLAWAGTPLWTQALPGILLYFFGQWLSLSMTKISHPELARVLPLRWDRAEYTYLTQQSFWVYLCSVGNAVFTSTDRLVINGTFGPDTVPLYQFNYKIPEIALFVIITMGFVSGPKLAQWLASDKAEDRDRGATEAARLNTYQAFLGIGAAVTYLLVNTWFMHLWMGAGMAAPMIIQVAFALTLAISAGCDTPVQASARTGPAGVRFLGIAVAGTALVNLALSFTAAKSGWLAGIAIATIIAQAALCVCAVFYCMPRIGQSPWKWLMRSLILPGLAVGLCGAMALADWPLLWRVGCTVVVLGISAKLLGLTVKALMEEVGRFRGAIFR